MLLSNHNVAGKIEDRNIIDNSKTETIALKYNFTTSLIERCV